MKIINIVFKIILTLVIFSLWAGFALLVVNPYLSESLPGYIVGSLCIWELIAFIIASLIAHFMIKKWGGIQFSKEEKSPKASLNFNYLIFFLLYFMLAVIVAIWQFWEFSSSF